MMTVEDFIKSKPLSDLLSIKVTYDKLDGENNHLFFTILALRSEIRSMSKNKYVPEAKKKQIQKVVEEIYETYYTVINTLQNNA